MTRRNVSTTCCHCGSRVRVLYRCRSHVGPDQPFRLRFDCPVCETALRLEAGEVFYDEAALPKEPVLPRLRLVHSRTQSPAPGAQGSVTRLFSSTPQLSLVE